MRTGRTVINGYELRMPPQQREPLVCTSSLGSPFLSALWCGGYSLDTYLVEAPGNGAQEKLSAVSNKLVLLKQQHDPLLCTLSDIGSVQTPG